MYPLPVLLRRYQGYQDVPIPYYLCVNGGNPSRTTPRVNGGNPIPYYLPHTTRQCSRAVTPLTPRSPTI